MHSNETQTHTVRERGEGELSQSFYSITWALVKLESCGCMYPQRHPQLEAQTHRRDKHSQEQGKLQKGSNIMSQTWQKPLVCVVLPYCTVINSKTLQHLNSCMDIQYCHYCIRSRSSRSSKSLVCAHNHSKMIKTGYFDINDKKLRFLSSNSLSTDVD